MRIGIVEDSPGNAVTAKVQIERYGAEVVGMWKSGEAFYEWINSNRATPLDILLLDIRLSHTNKYLPGNHWIILFKEQEQLKDTKIIAWTANITPESVEHYRVKGFDGCIGKPYDPKTFLYLLEQVIQGEKIWMTPNQPSF